jgi:hypothetical protein
MNLTAQPQDDDGIEMPCAEAMLAGTLALMTGHAESRCAQHKALMARKVVSNLFFLANHPALNANFRIVMGRMHQHWDALVGEQVGPALGKEGPAAGAWSVASAQLH